MSGNVQEVKDLGKKKQRKRTASRRNLLQSVLRREHRKMLSAPNPNEEVQGEGIWRLMKQVASGLHPDFQDAYPGLVKDLNDALDAGLAQFAEEQRGREGQGVKKKDQVSKEGLKSGSPDQERANKKKEEAKTEVKLEASGCPASDNSDDTNYSSSSSESFWGKPLNSEVTVETERFQVMLDVQRFRPRDISVKTVDNFIVVEGKHEEREDEHGFISRQFSRSYALPEDVKPESLECNLSSDDVLILSAPRSVKEPQERNVYVRQTGIPAMNKKEQPSPSTEAPKKTEAAAAPSSAADNTNTSREGRKIDI